MARKPRETDKFIALNRRAKFDYAIEDEIEAGLVLEGSEVKALREGKANIAEAYAAEKGGEIWLINANIPEYSQASPHFTHEPRRLRKLLLHAKERDKLIGATKREGMPLVPMSLYFNRRGLAKLKLGIGKGKKQHDKRDTIKQRDWDRQKKRIMKK